MPIPVSQPQSPNGRYSSPLQSFSAPDLKPAQTTAFPLTPPVQAMTTTGVGAAAGVGPKDNSSYHSRSFSSSTLANIPNTVADMKLKRRTPGRVQKLIADLYLMAGRLPDAVSQ